MQWLLARDRAGPAGGRPASALRRLVPRPLRDAGYRFVSPRCTRWFGRLAACRVPTTEQRVCFLDSA